MFCEPHSTKQREDAVGWALETSPETSLAREDAPPTVSGPEDTERLLRDVRCPVLAIHGDQDRCVPLSWSERIVELTGADLLVLEGAGHCPNGREPVVVSHAIRDFVDRFRAGPASPRRWTRPLDRRRRVLYLSSPIGLGHARRDLAIADELRELHPDLQVDWLAQHPVTELTACDLAVVQGGLTTTMELTAARRPFIYVPLRHHFEQNFHVRHRLDRYRAGRCLEYTDTGPVSLAQAMAAEMAVPSVTFRWKQTEPRGPPLAWPSSSEAARRGARFAQDVSQAVVPGQAAPRSTAARAGPRSPRRPSAGPSTTRAAASAATQGSRSTAASNGASTARACSGWPAVSQARATDRYASYPSTHASPSGSVAPASSRLASARTPRRAATVPPMGIPLSEAALRLVDEKNYAVLATVNPDGSPQTSVVWVGRDGEDLVFSTVEGRVKHRNMVRDPRVSVTVIDSADPENYVELRGRVTMTPDVGRRVDTQLSWKYDGKDPGEDRPGAVRVVVRMVVEKATGYAA